MKLFFLDLESTGTDVEKHGLHQISGKIIIDGEVKEYFDFKVKPRPNAFIDAKALQVCGVTFAQINQYPEMAEVYDKIEAMVLKYINQNDITDKFTFVGYNIQKFDIDHFARWFRGIGKLKFYTANFWNIGFDVMVLAAVYIGEQRRNMENFKQASVASKLGLDVDPSKLHTADYDIDLCQKIYDIVCGKY